MNWQRLMFWKKGEDLKPLTPEQIRELIEMMIPMVLIGSIIHFVGSQMRLKLKRSRWERFKDKIRRIRYKIGLWIAGIDEEDFYERGI